MNEVEPNPIHKIEPFGGGGSSSASYQMDGNITLDLTAVNCIVYMYLSGNYSLELPAPSAGQWLIVQNASLSTSGLSLTILTTNLWSAPSSALTPGAFLNFRAMDKDGTMLWRDINSTAGQVPV